MVRTYKDWIKMLPFSLHGYKTLVCTSIGVAPFSFCLWDACYSPSRGRDSFIKDSDGYQAWWGRMDSEKTWPTKLDWGGMISIHRSWSVVQKEDEESVYKKIRPQKFYPGDLVVKNIILLSHSDPRGNLTLNYEVLHIMKKAFSGGAIILTDMDGEVVPFPVNSDWVKKYYS